MPGLKVHLEDGGHEDPELARLEQGARLLGGGAEVEERVVSRGRAPLEAQGPYHSRKKIGREGGSLRGEDRTSYPREPQLGELGVEHWVAVLFAEALLENRRRRHELDLKHALRRLGMKGAAA